MHIEVVRYRDRLDNLFKQISNFSGDIELQAHWARYLCILVSGFLEISVKATFGDYAKTKAAPYVANYVESRLSGIQNPNMGRIIQLTKSFSDQWAEQLELSTEGKLKYAIDSIIANRNSIAHGGTVGITYARIQDYYQSAIKVIELIDEQCNA